MKKKVFTMIVLIIAGVIELQAQSIVTRIARKTRKATVDAVERNVEKKVEKAVDKAVDDAFSEVEKENIANHNDNNSQQGNPPVALAVVDGAR